MTEESTPDSGPPDEIRGLVDDGILNWPPARIESMPVHTHVLALRARGSRNVSEPTISETELILTRFGDDSGMRQAFLRFHKDGADTADLFPKYSNNRLYFHMPESDRASVLDAVRSEALTVFYMEWQNGERLAVLSRRVDFES